MTTFQKTVIFSALGLAIAYSIYSMFSTMNTLDEMEQRQLAAALAKDLDTQTKKTVRTNWADHIFISDIQYRYAEFSGISGLRFKLHNNSNYLLDEVKLRIDYIKANGEVYKSKLMAVSALPGQAIKLATAPSTSRGTSVKVIIHSISSHALNFCYNETLDVINNDPYRCQNE